MYICHYKQYNNGNLSSVNASVDKALGLCVVVVLNIPVDKALGLSAFELSVRSRAFRACFDLTVFGEQCMWQGWREVGPASNRHACSVFNTTS